MLMKPVRTPVPFVRFLSTLAALIAAISVANAQEPPERLWQPATMPAHVVPVPLLTPIQQPMPPMPPAPMPPLPGPMPPVGQPAPMPHLPATAEIICATGAGVCSLQSAAPVSPGTQCFCVLPGGDSVGGVTQ